MSLERAAMKGRLAELQQQAVRLRLKIDGTAKSLRAGLNTTLTPVEDLEIPELDEQWDTLKLAWGELIATRAQIERLEKELR